MTIQNFQYKSTVIQTQPGVLQQQAADWDNTPQSISPASRCKHPGTVTDTDQHRNHVTTFPSLEGNNEDNHPSLNHHQIGDKCQCSLSPTAGSDTNAHPHKIVCVIKGNQCPKLSDYDDDSQQLISEVISIYHSLISTKDAFPKMANETAMVKKAWFNAQEDLSLCGIAVTVNVFKLVRLYFSVLLLLIFTTDSQPRLPASR